MRKSYENQVSHPLLGTTAFLPLSEFQIRNDNNNKLSYTVTQFTEAETIPKHGDLRQ